MKIKIIGYTGGGKTTLVQWQASIYHIKRLSLDESHWVEGKYEMSPKEDLEIADRFMNSNDCWIVDGNYSYLLFEERLTAADLIIFLNINRCRYLYQTILRYFKRFSRAWKREEEFLLPSMKMVFPCAVFGTGCQEVCYGKRKIWNKNC